VLGIAGCLEKATCAAYVKSLACRFLVGFLFHAWARRALNHTDETVIEVLVLTGMGLVLSAKQYFWRIYKRIKIRYRLWSLADVLTRLIYVEVIGRGFGLFW
jgi:hypothetical protein